jgi:predicted DNA-binding transcriptional regulator AlpA
MTTMHDDDELLDIDAVRRFEGGSEKPPNRSTIWRRVRQGLLPPPIRIGTNQVRWLKSELIERRKQRIAERNAAMAAKHNVTA